MSQYITINTYTTGIYFKDPNFYERGDVALVLENRGWVRAQYNPTRYPILYLDFRILFYFTNSILLSNFNIHFTIYDVLILLN